jgi:DNA-3-methyladenine glycosylase
MNKVLGKDFFNRDALKVAKDLLGNYLVKSDKGKVYCYIITETEAYVGPEDKGSHAHKGKTDRNEVMFGPSGFWYLYLVYGMYWMLNVVTGPKDYPSAVLIRGIESHNGPGVLTRDLKINKKFNKKLACKKTGLWIEKNNSIKSKKIIRTPRIGINYAEEWKDKPFRFVLK